jgi:hypothetical protein
MLVLVKNTSAGIEVVIDNTDSFVDFIMATKVFVENQHVQNLPKYKKTNLINKEIFN